MKKVVIDGIEYVPKGTQSKTWTDPKTGLEWQLEAKEMPWHKAEAYAKSFGEDWRVPTVDELQTLLDRTKYDPAMRDEVGFSSSSYYWSSTTYAGDTSGAWGVHFNYGYVNNYDKTGYGYVRCVRG